MTFSELPPELISQAPMVAALLWIGMQARRELLAGLERMERGVDAVRGELRSLRRDLGQELPHEDYVGPNGAARP